MRCACAGWVEALEEILHNSRAPQILRQPDGTYLFAVQVRIVFPPIKRWSQTLRTHWSGSLQ